MLALRQPGDLSRVILALHSVTDGIYSRPTVTGNSINGRKGMDHVIYSILNTVGYTRYQDGFNFYLQYLKCCSQTVSLLKM